ncbi:MAG: GGDEF domain-containing protein [Polyangiaceae bacterium]|nr:GGDEF domain-containing protein [Polyangiaceae bacterium]
MSTERLPFMSSTQPREDRTAQLPESPSAYRSPEVGPPRSKRAGAPTVRSNVWQTHVAEWDDEEPGTSRSTEIGDPPPSLLTQDQAVLLRMEGAEAGRVYSLGDGCYELGRLAENAVVIDDADVSRHHARIWWRDGRHVIEDRGSRNGTYVQGRLVKAAELSGGELIQLGPRTSLRYERMDRRQEALLKQLYESSTRDGLTGAYNRKFYNDRLAAEVAFARRHGTQLGLILFDIDHFKNVNDRYGHPAGDVVLRQLAVRVTQQLRSEDLFARVGGEEFAVVLRGIPLHGCVHLAERLRAVVEAQPVPLEGRTLQVTISLGCAVLTGDKVSATELTNMTDERLYEAKRGGRNRVVPAP